MDRRGKREETMRTLRWAAELAVSPGLLDGIVGVAGLRALGRSPWLEAEDQRIIDAVTAAVTQAAGGAYREREQTPLAVLADLDAPAGNDEGESS